MSQTTAYDIDQIEKNGKIKQVFVHSFNDVTVIFDTDHVNPDLLNIVENNCSETPFVYDICNGINGKTCVSFEF